MFTGLIQDIGSIKDLEKKPENIRLKIVTGLDMSPINIGASIACSGCCLTVTELGNEWFSVDVSQETLSKTNIDGWDIGSKVNIEPSLKMGDELGGHLVSGHVDGLAKLIDLSEDGESRRLKIEVPEELSCFIASKGSVALDGVSLTINEVEDRVFGVNIIPHTWSHTTFNQCNIGDFLNIEVDMLARYAKRILSCAR